eukprot:scaffold2353_cov93-Skeletonema_dohrnii-CCMP3373.AAC.8
MNSTIATGKRKSDDAFPPAAADSHPNLFASLSDENWKIISSFAAPHDIYNLSLSSMHFFREAAASAAASEKNAASSSNDKKVLATQLLRASLLSSLGRVLQNSGSGITLDAVLKMGDLPEGSALIAGSTIVAACLGKDWSGGRNASDVDVHVEYWGSVAENFADNDGYESDEAKYRQKTIQWGKGTVEYANDVWKRSMQLGILGVVPINDGTHDLKPKPGGNLPFDFHGSGGIDLIVAKAGIPVSSLLNGFDLEICKASFDGNKFHIPDPHLTFAGKTKMESNRRAVVGSYVTYHREPENRYSMSTIELSRLVSSTIRAVRRDVPNAPFYRLLDVAAALPDRYNPRARPWDMGGSMYDAVVQAKWAPPIQFHNWCSKLIDRLRKYQQRGIEVVDAPTIADEYRANRYSIMSHGG